VLGLARFILALLENIHQEKNQGITLGECCQWIGCRRIHAQGLAAHGQTPQTWKQGRNLIDGIRNIRALEREYNENSKHN
jgi:hypothetical protein